jgi:dienelactone hydrolase
MSELTEKLLRVRVDCWDQPRREMLSADSLRAFKAANRRDLEAWEGVKTRSDWEGFRDARIEALRRSLGTPDDGPANARVRKTGELRGEGYRVEKLVFDGAVPGQPVTALLYLPEVAREGMPGILVCHSHHHSKEQLELQDMGVSWSRSGAAVLVPDMTGHGERSDNPFGGRQDYYGRYFSGMQLHLVGQSLMGWMVGDLGRGVEALLGTAGVDPEKIILVGAVAGGGDPVAVAAALDPRVKCAVPFNFGKACGWPKRMGAARSDGVNFCDSGSFESTRNLRLSSRGGFLPWLIVAAGAPRPLIYAHEFEWAAEDDPVWARLRKIYDFYEAGNMLAAVRGRGSVTGPGGSQNTHCNNVGPLHREQIYPAWKKWFDFEVAESQDRRAPSELTCMTAEARTEFAPRKIHQFCAQLGRKQLQASRQARAALAAEGGREKLREEWTELLGDVTPGNDTAVECVGEESLAGVRVERLVLSPEPGISLPLTLLRPEGTGPVPVVVGVSQSGKNAFLRARVAAVVQLLSDGIAVCLLDVRGTGETSPEAVPERGREGQANTVGSDQLMLGDTLLSARLRDLRAALEWLRGRSDLKSGGMALWGLSLAAVNPAGFAHPPQDGDGIDLRTGGGGPRDADRPAVAEPLGGLLAVLGALFEPDVHAVLLERDLISFASMLDSVCTCVPLDCHVPGALQAGDLARLTDALGVPIRSVASVDGLNQPVAKPAGAGDGECEGFAEIAAWFSSVLATSG